MKFKSLWWVACFSVGSFASSVFASAPVVRVSTQTVFVPKGFDDNDQVTIVLDGYLPSSCYRIDRTEKVVNQEARTVKVTQFARVYPGPCLLMLVPFTVELSLGVLPHGDYEIEANDGHLKRSLNIVSSTNSGPDDYFYAPIDKARVERGASGNYHAVLEGRFTNSCMSLGEVRTTYSGPTIEVLPIMEVADRSDCHPQEVPFSKIIPINYLLPQRYLLHVRSLNGKAVNTVFSVFDTGDPIF